MPSSSTLEMARSCYVSGDKWSSLEAIIAIHKERALRSLPVPISSSQSRLLKNSLSFPLMALRPTMEELLLAYENEQWVETANRRGLFATGGSDFHGLVKPDVLLGVLLHRNLLLRSSSNTLMNYHDCLEQLFSANTRGVKCGLANMQAVMALLGSPHTRYRSIHIASTNGKGSTATKMAAALTCEGYKWASIPRRTSLRFASAFRSMGG